jgi:hypothetical protein
MFYIEFYPTNQTVREMQEFLLIGLAIGAVVSLVLSVVLLRFGVIIDRFPVGEEEKRDRSHWSPIEFTRTSVVIFWLLFIAGGWMALQQSRRLMIGGITILVGLVLFLFTAVIFSMAILNLMSSKRSGNGTSPPVVGGSRKKRSGRLFPSLRLAKNGKYPRIRSSMQKK